LNLAFRDTVQSIAMTHWKLTLAYDGTSFRGWQVQPNLPTVQGLLSDAIHRTTGERVLPQGSGRTDAGVHALAQVASFTLAAPIPAANLHRALNRCLPPSVRVLAVEAIPPDFHARHSALRKTYEYRIFPLHRMPGKEAVILSEARRVQRRAQSKDPENLGAIKTDRSVLTDEFLDSDESICPPTLAPTVWPCPWPLDLSALNQAAAHVLGAHDFTSFAAADPDLTHRSASIQDSVIPIGGGAFAAAVEGPPHLLSPAPARTIHHSQWHISGDLLIYRVTADGFLHHMVRNLVGTFVLCGAHRLSPDSIPALLVARDRARAGPTAPASGLFLVSVDYPAPESCQDPRSSNSPVTDRI
jgi:tRNA pseudouridine38-40 synthase